MTVDIKDVVKEIINQSISNVILNGVFGYVYGAIVNVDKKLAMQALVIGGIARVVLDMSVGLTFT